MHNSMKGSADSLWLDDSRHDEHGQQRPDPATRCGTEENDSVWYGGRELRPSKLCGEHLSGMSREHGSLTKMSAANEHANEAGTPM